jgi:hypothetical protein
MRSNSLCLKGNVLMSSFQSSEKSYFKKIASFSAIMYDDPSFLQEMSKAANDPTTCLRFSCGISL